MLSMRLFLWDDMTAAMLPWDYYTPKCIWTFKTAYLTKVSQHKHVTLTNQHNLSQVTYSQVIRESKESKSSSKAISTTSSVNKVQFDEINLAKLTQEDQILQARPQGNCTRKLQTSQCETAQ